MVLSTLRNALTTTPLLKSVVTVTSLIGGADICCQVIEHRGFMNFDWTRLRNMATMGIMYYGPLYYYYYGFLDRTLPGKSPRTVLIKLFIDQFIYTIPSLLCFYVIMGKLEQKPWPEIKDEVRMKYIPTYVTACLFWPAAQAVNFSLVPPVHRILYISTANFVWLVFLSYIKNRPKLPAIFERLQMIGQSPNDIDKSTWCIQCFQKISFHYHLDKEAELLHTLVLADKLFFPERHKSNSLNKISLS